MPQDNQKSFNDLDEVGMEAVCKFLSLRDLAAMRLTCKRWKVEAERYFTMHHEIHWEPVEIKSMDKRVGFVFKHAETTYERLLEPLIRYVNCNFHGDLTIKDCQFIKVHCAEQLRSLTLNFINGRCDTKIDVSPIAVMKDQLKHVKELKVFNLIVHDLYNEVLQHCENLESLTIDINRGRNSDCIGVYGYNWSLQRYPHLKTLKLFVPTSLTFNLTTLLSTNPHLTNLMSCNYGAIMDICRSETVFQHVTFVFLFQGFFVFLMQTIVGWLKHKRFMEFELVISACRGLTSDNILEMATTFENITSLHLGNYIICYFNRDISMPSVKMLCLNFKPDDNLGRERQLTMGTTTIFNEAFISYTVRRFRYAAVPFDLLNKLFPNLCKLKMKKGNDVIDNIDGVVRRFKRLRDFEYINEQCDLCMLSD